MAAQAAELLAAEEAERHRRVVVVIDESHLLSPAQLEEIRLLTNQSMDASSPFAGILIGQPTLSRQLRMGVFAALDQRIGMRYCIPAMDLTESTSYLRHHLGLVGRTDALIADDAIARLHRFSGGIPRALNNARAVQPSWQRRPKARPWSTTPAPRPQWPSSPGSDAPMKRPGARRYLPDEIAYAVVRLSQGLSLAQVAAELGRDRSGLLRMLKALGYPTGPKRLNPEEARSRVEKRIGDMKTPSRQIKERLLQLRGQDSASSSTAARPSSLNPANP